MVDLGTLILILQVVTIVAASWLVSELLIRVIARTAKRAGASQGLLRSIREGLTVLWIAIAAVGLLSVTGIASEFSFLTLSGIV